MIEDLDSWGVRFEKDQNGEYAVRKVHHVGTYVLPMPEGHDVKAVLYRQLKRNRVEITNRLVATRLLLADDGGIAGAMAFDCRTAELHIIRTKSVVLATGAAGRLGLPSSGYLFGTYENPARSDTVRVGFEPERMKRWPAMMLFVDVNDTHGREKM